MAGGRLPATIAVAVAVSVCFSVFTRAEPPALALALAPAPPPMMLTVEGTNVWIQRFRSNQREAAYPTQILEVKDRGYTGRRSRATVRLSDLSVARVSEQSEFEIEPLPEPGVDGTVSLFRGLLYLLHRDRPGSHRFKTPSATAATRGTEFTLEVDPGTGQTTLTVLEGEAELSNLAGSVILASGEQAVASLGQRPTKTAVIDTTNLVQWCLYYPAVLDLSELTLTAGEQAILDPALAAYRSGDLLQAVSAYPPGRAPGSDEEKVYASALLLAIGQVAAAETLLDSGPTPPRGRVRQLGDALRLLIAAVRGRGVPLPPEEQPTGRLATEWLADSYARQSAGDLDGALESARRSVGRSPGFAFAWSRVAELEFSHGNTRGAWRALERARALAPRHAQALALQGFLLAAQNNSRASLAWFEQAMAIDGGLGNAWLGRGLCRIRNGDGAGGRFDLQVAATLEPRRSLLRSYLGKAFSNAGDSRRALRELDLAREIDAGDPTPWLYSALLLQQQNRLNQAVRDLEHSEELNDNRSVYRSRLLLDQDRAVRSANLAAVYRDNGLTDVSLREAGRAVSADYANDAAHLFLANSFNELRDPKRINLRYETATLSEFLLANLLAPVGAGALSQPVSEQEYGRLFERDRLGFTSSTEYRSAGDWSEAAAQYGTLGNSAYALDVFYQSQRGQRPNNDAELVESDATFKQQVTPQDTVLLQATYHTFASGDLNYYYHEKEANPLLRIQESQEPLLLAGYHHDWAPGMHTLALFTRLHDTYEVSNPLQETLLFNRGVGGPIGAVAPLVYRQAYQSTLEIYSGELQQIWQRGDHAFVAGARFQGGEIATRNQQTDGVLFTSNLVSFSVRQDLPAGFDRESVYLYDDWQAWETLLVAGGFSYDRIRFPENYRYAPVTGAEVTRDQVSPKAGLIFTPRAGSTVRAAYTRGLGGVSLDQSYRLEPSQVAGFNQAFRSLLPESVAGANAAPTFDAWSLSLEQKLGRGTYLGVGGEILSSQVDRRIGVVQFSVSPFQPTPYSAIQTPEQLDFRERSLLVTLNQLVGEDWALVGRYRLSRADYESRFPSIPAAAVPLGGFQPNQHQEAVLQQLQLSALYHHPSGFFAGTDAIWTSQSNQGYRPDEPGDDFWQFNVEAGWRFLQRRVEARVALLNLAGHDYRLNPLNLTAELPRQRTLALRLQLNF